MSDKTSVDLIESVFCHLSYADQIVVMSRLLKRLDNCPRCLAPYRFKEEKEAKICGDCVLSFVKIRTMSGG